MTGAFVDIHLPGASHPRRGRRLAGLPAEGAQPALEVYFCFEYLLALKLHSDGRVEHEEIWRSDDPCDGRCLPVTPFTQAQIRADVARWFGPGPRTEALLRLLDSGGEY